MTHIAQYISAGVLAIFAATTVLVILADLGRILRRFLSQRTLRKLGPKRPNDQDSLRGDGKSQTRMSARPAMALGLTANPWKES
jgi:hypothetical protein